MPRNPRSRSCSSAGGGANACVIPSRGTTRRVDDDGNGSTVILSRGDGEGSQVAHFEILRRASPTQDDGGVIRSGARDPPPKGIPRSARNDTRGGGGTPPVRPAGRRRHDVG